MDPQILQLIQQYLGQMGQPNPNLHGSQQLQIPYGLDANSEPVMRATASYGMEPRPAYQQHQPPRSQSLVSAFNVPTMWDQTKQILQADQNALMKNLPRTRAERPKHNSK